MAPGPAKQTHSSNAEHAVFSPEPSRGELLIAIALAAASFAFLWPLRTYSTLFPDEGIALQGAVRILEGQVLYRDFFAFYTPGSYYLLAGMFKVFGASYVAARTLLPVYGALLTPLTYLMARRVSGRWNSLFVAFLFLITGIPLRPFVLHNWDSAVTATLALYAALRWLESRSSLAAFLAGTFAALTFLFEQSKGAGVLLGLAAGFALIFWLGRSERPRQENVILSPGRNRRGEESVGPLDYPLTSDPSASSTDKVGGGTLRMTAPGAGRLSWASPLVAAFAGLLWPILATSVYFASKGALGAMLAGWFWPLQNYSAANKTSYGWVNLGTGAWETLYGSPTGVERLFYLFVTSPHFIVPSLPFLALLVAAIHFRRLRRGTESQGPFSSLYFVLCGACIVGLTLSAIATRRPDFDHLLYLAPPLFLPFAWIFQDGCALPSRFLDRVRPLLAVFVLISFTAFGLAFWLRGAVIARHPLETRRGTVRVASPDQVVPYLIQNVRPGSKIFVYPYQPFYYFLSATFSPTRFEFLQLGMHSMDQLERTLRDLDKESPELVLYGPAFNYMGIPIIWPATPADVVARDPVRDYILENYRYCRSVLPAELRYYLMVRSNLECPQ